MFVLKDSKLVDPETGDELRTTFAHRQVDYETVGIFSAEGVQKFGARLKVRPIDPPHPTDDKTNRLILTSAVEYDASGSPTFVYGPHPDIDRLIAYRRARAEQWQIPFEFVDERKEPVPLNQEQLRSVAKAAGWTQSKKARPRSSC
jgi:hypothetical protein